MWRLELGQDTEQLDLDLGEAESGIGDVERHCCRAFRVRYLNVCRSENSSDDRLSFNRRRTKSERRLAAITPQLQECASNYQILNPAVRTDARVGKGCPMK
jgi:hypothetical protein